MKYCSSCRYPNPDNRDSCFKCETVLPSQQSTNSPQGACQSSPQYMHGLHYRDLFKLATDLKSQGKLSEAAECVRKAIEKSHRAGVTHGMNQYVRLPMYLYQAGREREAWQEFHKLLDNRLRPGQDSEGLGVGFMESAIVFDKMSLCLCRSGGFKQAIKYSVMAYLCEVAGLCLQRRKREACPLITKTAVSDFVKDLLEDQEMDDLIQPITILMLQQVSLLPNIDLRKVAKDVDCLILQ